MINCKDNKELKILNQSCAQLLAHAIKNLYPNVKLWLPQITEQGFYYDVDLDTISLKESDLKLISKEMKKIIKKDKRIYQIEVTKKEALSLFKDERYKIELIENKINEEKIIVYKQDNFIDLSNGPYVESAKLLKHFILTKLGGAYYKNNSNNQMLTRIYGICLINECQLKDYNQFLEEAKERDHRKIGKDLDLFCFSDHVGAGLPLFTPRGTIIKDELQKEVEKMCRKYGFEKVSCPSLANISLFETSGHAGKFNEELFRVESPKGHRMVLKPVQCPHHTQIYASKIRSYKDLPIRYMESDKQYRAELQGAIGGLSRVYAITVEDGHSFCRVDQVKQEVINMCHIIKEFYSKLGLWGNHWVSLSVRDYAHLEKYIGNRKDWEICEEMLQEISDELGLNAKKCEGEAALYGPKLDFMFKDAMGREIQIPTVQLDFATAKRFELTYINQDGSKATPVMVHRAILGSYERFLVLLLEQFMGVLPLWLSPVQINIVPVNNDFHLEYCEKVKERLVDLDLRVAIDSSEKRFNYKLRQSNLMKNPYTLIVGDLEKETENITYRRFGTIDSTTIKLEDFIYLIKNELSDK